MDWQLEFTVSTEKPKSTFDEDDALVFYVNSIEELDLKRNTLLNKGIELLKPKNPYWLENGIMIQDPDGFNIIFSVRHIEFRSQDDLTLSLREHNIANFSELLAHVKEIPYGRNKNRNDFFWS